MIGGQRYDHVMRLNTVNKPGEVFFYTIFIVPKKHSSSSSFRFYPSLSTPAV
jgi:hypothetical protein